MGEDPKRQGELETTVHAPGLEVPMIGLGTWNLRGARASRVVQAALELGYRHIDTAEMYRNESEIGRAIEDASIPREELFIVSKVWKNHMRPDQVVAACRDSCARLRVDWVDLYLIHWPNSRVPIEETMAGMVSVVADGLARAVGVSNFSRAQWEHAQAVSSVPVVCNQVRFSARRRQDELVAYAGNHQLLLTAYTPLDKGRLAGEPVLRRIAGAIGHTPLQVALRWLIQQAQVAAIPKASSRDHLIENLGALSFELSSDDVRAVDAIAG
jgi:2,5-diketo-D-gluconate reductase B